MIKFNPLGNKPLRQSFKLCYPLTFQTHRQLLVHRQCLATKLKKRKHIPHYHRSKEIMVKITRKKRKICKNDSKRKFSKTGKKAVAHQRK